MGVTFIDSANRLRYEETRGNGIWRMAFGVAGALALLVTSI